MTHRHRGLILLILLVLAGCGSPPPETSADKQNYQKPGATDASKQGAH